MQTVQWFIHIQGETFGPIPSDVVQIMLRQNRLQFSDFVWTEGLTKWTRISEVHHFVHLMPPYPQAPIPTGGQITSGAIPAAAPAEPPPFREPLPRVAAAAPAAAQAPRAAAAPMAQPTPTVRPQGVPDTPLKAWIRRYGRVTMEGSVSVDGQGVFPVVDISEGGVFLSASSPIPFGTDLRFRLDSPSLTKSLDMTGIVIREGNSEDGQAGFAIQFTRVNPAHRRVIHEYVKSKMAKQD